MIGSRSLERSGAPYQEGAHGGGASSPAVPVARPTPTMTEWWNAPGDSAWIFRFQTAPCVEDRDPKVQNRCPVLEQTRHQLRYQTWYDVEEAGHRVLATQLFQRLGLVPGYGHQGAGLESDRVAKLRAPFQGRQVELPPPGLNTRQEHGGLQMAPTGTFVRQIRHF